ncbi:siderophore-interacting protein [Rhodococcus aetherivorans]|uniref:siderophore-interacting protein n=1 Tax=Rhodococcus aetherivorans TaxID=191292 RepID=UPI00163AD896|nr:siderophore-interacting protein [Rhodococcus aetherivorans]MBC2588674.1 siderophore-interacting protein [Rhodococcus aetherivorans]
MAVRTKTTRIAPASREIVTGRVLATERIGPSFVRVTVGGANVGRIAPMGFDQWFRLFFPAPGQRSLTLPATAGPQWWPEMRAMPEGVQPILRNYTIRRYREAGAGRYGDTAELDIDFATHGDTGPASQWARTAQPGAELALLDEGIMYHRPTEARWQILVADESALPAIAGILASSAGRHHAVPTEVFVEVDDAGDVAAQEIVPGPGVRLHTVVRPGRHAPPGPHVLEAVRAGALPDGPGYAFLAGESGLVTSLRRHLVRERGLAKSAVTFTGYWKFGAASY